MLDMKRIFLLCSAGMSTSLLVSKMKEAAKKQGYECDIAASSLANLKDIKDKADVILLGPQVRFDKERVEKETNIPVGVVDMAAYGMMDGEKALNQARKLLGEL
jgi:PTS system cellobiose-specific IIB component